jgi:hypothetical protein
MNGRIMESPASNIEFGSIQSRKKFWTTDWISELIHAIILSI